MSGSQPLETGQIGIRNRREISVKPTVAYRADRWSCDDLKLINATLGDPAAQAKCEALTLLASIATWRPILLAAQGSLTIVGDALGVLHDALKLKAKEAILNGLMGEIALLLAPLGADIRPPTSGRKETKFATPSAGRTKARKLNLNSLKGHHEWPAHLHRESYLIPCSRKHNWTLKCYEFLASHHAQARQSNELSKSHVSRMLTARV